MDRIEQEHTNEQLADEIFRTKGLNVGVMAVMRRIAISGSPLYGRSKPDIRRNGRKPARQRAQYREGQRFFGGVRKEAT